MLVASRFARSLCVLAVVGVSYFAYSLVAVPLLEPRARMHRGRSDAPSAPAPAAPDAALSRLFPPGFLDWELQQPKMLRTDQGMLLFREYRPTDDGQIELQPLTIVFCGDKQEGDKNARPLALRAPQGAVLQFDGPLNVLSGSLGRLVGGRIPGEVVIRSPESKPGQEDALEIHSRNLQLERSRIWTPHDVRFRFGRSFGSGRDLTIRLADNPASSTPRGSLRKLELTHVDKVHLELPADGLFAKSPGSADNPARDTSPQRPGLAETPVEVTCAGPLQFDFVDHRLTFEDQVELARIHANGLRDLLQCKLLTIRFGAKEEPGASPPAGSVGAGAPRDPASPDVLRTLTVSEIEASGTPVVLTVPSVGAKARGERLLYDVRQRRVRVEDRRGASLEHTGRHVDAVALEYEMPEDMRRLGKLWAQGPGRFRAEGQGRPEVAPQSSAGLRNNPAASVSGQPMDLSWQHELRLRPHEGLHVASVTGGGEVRSPSLGQLSATEMHVWLREEMRGRQAEILPVRLLATGTPATEKQPEQLVHIDTPQLVGDTQRLEVWIRHEAPDGKSPAEKSPVAPVALPGTATVVAPQPRPNLPLPVFRQPAENAAGGPPVTAPGPPQDRFAARGDLVRAELVSDGVRPRLEKAAVLGRVRVRQIASEMPDKPPIELDGNEVQIANNAANLATLHLLGEPARVVMEGLTVVSTNIHLRQDENRLWIDGPGEMQLPDNVSPKRERGPPQAALPRDARITWQKRFDFDGLRARLEDGVVARGSHLLDNGSVQDATIRAAWLDVLLVSRVRFASALAKESGPRARPAASRADWSSLTFDGGVTIENRGRSATGAPESFDRLQVRNLTLEQATGAIRAAGPGWADSVRFGQQFSSALSPGVGPTGTPPPNRLVNLHIDFVAGIEGNFQRRHLDFVEQVRTYYGPVAGWDQRLDPERPASPSHDIVTLTSDRLSVAETGGGEPVVGPYGSPLGSALEMQATGNAVLVGRGFTARGARISYARAKELYVLEGNGRGDAQLWLQGNTNPDAVAQTIRFFAQERRFDADGIRFLNVNPLGPGLRSALPTQTVPR